MSQKSPGHDDDLEQPTPPGGPLRRDAPSGEQTPGEGAQAQDPGPEVQRVTREPGRNPALDDLPDRGPDQSQTEAALQQENAETSQDQPSQ